MRFISKGVAPRRFDYGQCMRNYHFIWPLLGLILGREFFTFIPLRLPVQVVRVLDGDTLELRGGERLRLAGVDAPEKGQPTRVGGLDAGWLAKGCLDFALQGKSWRLEPKGRDIYGRQLGELWIDKQSLSQILVERGCASVYPFYDDPALWRSLERAKRKRKGLWAHGGFMRPYWWRRLSSKKKSHRSGFSYKREEKRVARKLSATR